MHRGTFLSYIGRGVFGVIGCIGLVPNVYYLLFPIASIIEGYLQPDALYVARLGLLVGGTLVSLLLLFGAARGWHIVGLALLALLLVGEYAVVRSGVLN